MSLQTFQLTLASLFRLTVGDQDWAGIYGDDDIMGEEHNTLCSNQKMHITLAVASHPFMRTYKL